MVIVVWDVIGLHTSQHQSAPMSAAFAVSCQQRPASRQWRIGMSCAGRRGKRLALVVCGGWRVDWFCDFPADSVSYMAWRL